MAKELLEALMPLVKIAKAYHANGLDEARPDWDDDIVPEQVELFTGRGGSRLLTLADCLEAERVYKSVSTY